MALKDDRDLTKPCHAQTMCVDLFDLFAVGGLRLGCWHNAGAALCTETRILYCFPPFVLTNSSMVLRYAASCIPLPKRILLVAGWTNNKPRLCECSRCESCAAVPPKSGSSSSISGVTGRLRSDGFVICNYTCGHHPIQISRRTWLSHNTPTRQPQFTSTSLKRPPTLSP